MGFPENLNYSYSSSNFESKLSTKAFVHTNVDFRSRRSVQTPTLSLLSVPLSVSLPSTRSVSDGRDERPRLACHGDGGCSGTGSCRSGTSSHLSAAACCSGLTPTSSLLHLALLRSALRTHTHNSRPHHSTSAAHIATQAALRQISSAAQSVRGARSAARTT